MGSFDSCQQKTNMSESKITCFMALVPQAFLNIARSPKRIIRSRQPAFFETVPGLTQFSGAVRVQARAYPFCWNSGLEKEVSFFSCQRSTRQKFPPKEDCTSATRQPSQPLRCNLSLPNHAIMCAENQTAGWECSPALNTFLDPWFVGCGSANVRWPGLYEGCV